MGIAHYGWGGTAPISLGVENLNYRTLSPEGSNWLDHISTIAANSEVSMVIRDHLTGPSLNSLLDLNIFPRPDYWRHATVEEHYGPYGLSS